MGFFSSKNVTDFLTCFENHPCIQKTARDNTISIYSNADTTEVLVEKWFYLFSYVFSCTTDYDSFAMLNLFRENLFTYLHRDNSVLQIHFELDLSFQVKSGKICNEPEQDFER